MVAETRGWCAASCAPACALTVTAWLCRLHERRPAHFGRSARSRSAADERTIKLRSRPEAGCLVGAAMVLPSMSHGACDAARVTTKGIRDDVDDDARLFRLLESD